MRVDKFAFRRCLYTDLMSSKSEFMSLLLEVMWGKL